MGTVRKVLTGLLTGVLALIFITAGILKVTPKLSVELHKKIVSFFYIIAHSRFYLWFILAICFHHNRVYLRKVLILTCCNQYWLYFKNMQKQLYLIIAIP